MGAEAAVESRSFAFVESLAADLSGGTPGFAVVPGSRDHEGDVDFTDLLMMANIVSGLLGDGFEVQLDEVPASQYFTTSVEEFFAILSESAEHISSLRHALGT